MRSQLFTLLFLAVAAEWKALKTLPGKQRNFFSKQKLRVNARKPSSPQQQQQPVPDSAELPKQSKSYGGPSPPPQLYGAPAPFDSPVSESSQIKGQ